LEYRGALVYACGAYQEPLGLAPLEAMAYGVPVVAAAEGGLLETVKDQQTGYLVRRDPNEFSMRLASLLSNPDLRKEMGAAARAHVETNWAWPERAKAFERELESVAASRKAGNLTG
jgi:glycosyltransferase involved in cell wall biosynthesis